jgi:hypothetical protein
VIAKYDKIVIGSSFSAVLYAFINNYPIFFAEERRPFRFDYLEPGIDLSCLKIPTCNKSLTTFDGDKKIGYSKELLWEKLLFLMAVEGRSPLSNLCGTIRYDGDTVVCSNEYSKIMELKFNECYYFGDKKTTGIIQENQLDEDTYICYDYIGFNKGGKHEIDYIKTEDNFVREIWFYPSDRIDGDTPVRDACAVSVLTESQIEEFDYSQTMSRFKAVYEMESQGMKGAIAGGKTTAGNPRYYKFRTTSLYRETYKRGFDVTPESDNVKIPKVDQKSMLEDLPQACVAYDRFLRYW